MSIDTQLIKKNTKITDYAAMEEYAHTPVVQHFFKPLDDIAIRTDHIIPRGTAELPFICNRLPYLEFIYIMSGDVHLSLQNGPQNWCGNYISEGVRALAYNTEVSGIVRINSTTPIREMHLYITPQKLTQLLGHGSGYLVQTIIDSTRLGNRKGSSLGIINPLVSSIIHQILTRDGKSPVDSLFLKSKILELLAREVELLTQKKCKETLLQPDDIVKLEKAKSIMAEQMTTPPSIAELSRNVGLNEKKIKQGFKELFGTTVYGFLRDYRIEQAKVMFDSAHTSVSDVACAVGYSNIGYFSKLFKHYHGIRPGEYLRSLKKDRVYHHLNL